MKTTEQLLNSALSVAFQGPKEKYGYKGKLTKRSYFYLDTTEQQSTTGYIMTWIDDAVCYADVLTTLSNRAGRPITSLLGR